MRRENMHKTKITQAIIATHAVIKVGFLAHFFTNI